MKIPRPLRGARRNSIRIYMAVAGLFLIRFAPAPFLAGTALVMAGSILRFWAKGYLQQNRVLTTGGPYRFTRNPFYLGNALLDLGICFMVGRIDFLLVFLALWILIHASTITKEEGRLTEIFGKDYTDYRSQVPWLIPVPWRYLPAEKTDQQFSWWNENISHDLEIPRTLRTVALPALFYCASVVRAEGWAPLLDSNRLGFLALTTLVFLYVLSTVLKKPIRYRKWSLPGPAKGTPARAAFFVLYILFLFFNRGLETEVAVIYPAGLAAAGALAAFFAVLFLSSRSPDLSNRFIIAQWVLCLFAAAMAKLPWAGLIASLYYACLLADTVLVPAAGPSAPAGIPGGMKNRIYFTLLSCLLLGLISALMVLKEYLGHGGRLIL